MTNGNTGKLADDPLWYKDAIVYQLHVKAFFDSSDDGIGDFRGLIQKLDYIQDLGVNTIWLLPFYPSPLRDDGYDIADYRGVLKEYGTPADFRQFVRDAHQRGLRVITELVINHTSDQHPWFQAARRAPPGSKKRDYYVWSQTNQKFADTRIIFTDTEKSNWAWDDTAKSYYWHRFFSHQPDLNHNNPAVVRAVTRVMRYWLDMGVDGLRLDAIPYLCVREGTNNENLPETHAVLRQMRAVIDANYPNRMFLAEANQWPEDVREYFGDGDECHMAYHFPLMPRMYMAVAQEDRHPIVEIMRQTPDIPNECQWAIFLRNHDELTLEMVTSRERDYMYRMYAADPRARVNVGIRRRLAPLLENNRAKIELMTSLLLTMPGSPILYYGDEIGMGDNIFLGDRNGVRTPMQWSPDRNAGFSRADPQRLYLPPIMDPMYGYQSVNVESQLRSPSSLLHWTRRMISARKSFKAFGRGDLVFLEPGNRKILAYLRHWEDEILLCVANLSSSPQPVELSLGKYRGRVPVHLTSRVPFPPIGDAPYLLTLPAYGFYAFRLATDVDQPHWHQEVAPRTSLPVLVLLEGWNTFNALRSDSSEVRRLMASRTRKQLEREVIAPYLSSRRWFGAKGHPIERLAVRTEGEWPTDSGSWLLTFIEVKPEGQESQTYCLPLGLAWEGQPEDKLAALSPWTLAKVRQKAREGMLYGAFGDDDFCRALLRTVGENAAVSLGDGTLHCIATTAFPEIAAGALDEPVVHPSLEQSNTTVFFGKKLFLKAYRRLHPGSHPELEMGRFLTEASPFGHVVPLAGAIEYQRADGTRFTLALLQAYVENQGDAWHYTLDYLGRYLTQLPAQATPEADQPAESPHRFYLELIHTLGQRIGELHKALAVTTGDPLFDPEPVTADDVRGWVDTIRGEAASTLAMLRERTENLPGPVQELAECVCRSEAALMARLDASLQAEPRFARTRFHGDLHLGQILLADNDFMITDFEGEPTRSFAERRAKHSPLKDVAGILRSFNYAAHSALKHVTAEQQGDLATLRPVALGWEEETRAAFLGGYTEGVGTAVSMPADDESAQRLLDILVIEKALYEVRYELEHRPAWLDIPLTGLLQVVSPNDW
ncbi:MAG: maltose alpha-D-glucosyltransferase [Rhodocyclaceae bacterium]